MKKLKNLQNINPSVMRGWDIIVVVLCGPWPLIESVVNEPSAGVVCQSLKHH